MTDRVVNLRGHDGLIEDTRTPAQRASDRFAETRAMAEQAAQHALAALTEAAHQCGEVAALGDALKPGVADGLRQAGAAAGNYADKIGRML